MALTPVSHVSTTAPTGAPTAASGSATGHLAGHSVTVGTGATPLVADGQGVVQTVGDLFKRVIASLPGAGRQVTQQAYGDLDAKGRMEVLGRLENSLSKAAVALTKEKAGAVPDVVKALGAFAANLAPLVGHDGAGEALSQVVKGVVAQLSPEQAVATLKAIGSQRGAEVQSRLLDQPVASQGLQLLERGLADAVLFNERCKVMEVTRKMIPKGIPSTGTALTGTERKLIQDGYREAYKTLLSSYGRMQQLGVLSTSDDARLGYINTELAKLLRGPINADKSNADPAILGALGSEYLQLLNLHARHEDGRPMVPEVADELARRRDAMVTGFADKVDAFSITYQLTEDVDMKALVKDLAEVATMGVAGLKFAAHSGIDATGLRQDMDKLGQQLNDLAKEGKLNFSSLSDAEAHALEIACSATGAGDVRANIARECENRSNTIRKDYHRAIDTIVKAANGGSISELFQATRDSVAVRNKVAFSLEPFGIDLKGADDRWDLRAFLMDDRINELWVDDLKQLLKVLREPAVRAIAGGLPELASGLMDNSGDIDVERYDQVNGTGIDLQFLTQSVERRLASLGALPVDNHAGQKLGLKDIDDAGFAVIRDVFHIEANRAGVIRALSGTVSGTSGADFARAVTTAPSTAMQLEHAKIVATELGVCEQFLLDMHRARYSAGGMPLIDRGAWELNGGDLGGEIDMQRAGIDRLNTALDNDYSLIFAVSQYANQATLAPLMILLAGEHSPLKLADGTVGCVMSGPGQQESSYDIALTKDGEATIGFNFAMKGRQFMTTDGRDCLLEPYHGTAEFTFELTVDRDGAARLTKPLRFNFDLKQDVGDKFVTDMGQARYEALRAWARKEFSTENFDFMDDYRDYIKSGDVELARSMYEKYFKAGSESEINVPSNQWKIVRNAFEQGDVPENIFADVVYTVMFNIKDTNDRFSNSEEGKKYDRQ